MGDLFPHCFSSSSPPVKTAFSDCCHNPKVKNNNLCAVCFYYSNLKKHKPQRVNQPCVFKHIFVFLECCIVEMWRQVIALDFYASRQYFSCHKRKTVLLYPPWILSMSVNSLYWLLSLRKGYVEFILKINSRTVWKWQRIRTVRNIKRKKSLLCTYFSISSVPDHPSRLMFNAILRNTWDRELRTQKLDFITELVRESCICAGIQAPHCPYKLC